MWQKNIIGNFTLWLSLFASISQFIINNKVKNNKYDIDYYKSLIEGGYVKDNDLWIFWMKTESHSPNEIRELHTVCEELILDESKVVFINGDLTLYNFR